MTSRPPRPGISRRSFLIGGGAGVGLLLAWAAWPRSYSANLVAAEGEEIFNAFLKIGEDGHVTVVVPQAEMGQGVWTTLPQALADELGADWRTVGVEPAPINSLYANDLWFGEQAALFPELLGGAGGWAARELAIRNAVMVTAGSTSLRGFETRFREAGAAARAMLCRAAAARWDVDWTECDTAGGFVRHGESRRLRFGELAAEAAALDPPGEVTLRAPGAGRISGAAMPRLDLPAKVDGSARYAADVRLPNMVFASARKAPATGFRLKSVDRAAAEDVLGVMAVFENPDFVACAATNWWAANRGVDALNPVWEGGVPPDDARIDATLEGAIEAVEGTRFVDEGDVGAAFAAGGVWRANYAVGLAAHAQLEPLVATARVEGDRLEIWAPTQAPGAMRAAVARATGFGEGRVTIYPMLVGGGFGRKLESDAAVQAAIVSTKLNRPVQLAWSREEETARGRFRPPARARMFGKLAPEGTLLAWHAQIAAPSVNCAMLGRLMPGMPLVGGDGAERAAIEGARPAYAIPNVAIEHLPCDVGVDCGLWRSGAQSYTCFFTESFIDELARKTPLEPLSFRMAMLGGRARLARCLSAAAQMASWDGGAQGGGMGLAAVSAFGSHIAMVARVHIDERQRIVVDQVSAAVDCGRVVNPEIVRQQIEGGIIFGMGAALGGRIGFADGQPHVVNYDGLALPTLASSPEIEVQIIGSAEAPGGVGGIAVPPIAPAIGNAVFAANGQRLRRLPFIVGDTVLGGGDSA